MCNKKVFKLLKNKVYVFNFLFCLINFYGFGQNGISPKGYIDNGIDSLKLKEAKNKLNTAISLSRYSINHASFNYIDQSLKIYKRYGLWDKYVNGICYKGHIYYYNNMYDSSLYFYNRSMQIAKKKCDNLKMQVNILNFIADLNATVKKDFKLAIKFYKQAISYFSFIEDCAEKVNTYHQLSYVYLTLIDLDLSLEYLNKSFFIKKKLGMNGLRIGLYYDNLGSILYDQNKLEESKEAFQKALKIYSEIKYFKGILESYYFLSKIESKRENFNKSNDLIIKGLNLVKDSSVRKYLYLKYQKLYINLAINYFKLKDLKKSHYYHLLSLKVAKNKNHSLVNLHLGDSYINLCKYDSALLCFQKGINSIQPEFRDNNIYKNPSLSTVKNKTRLLWLLRSKSRAFYNKYFYEGEQNFKDLKSAFETNQLALELVDIMLDNYESSGSRLAWSEFMRSVYYQSIIISHALYKATGEEKYLHKAFEIAEKSKAGVLMADMKSTDAKKFSGIADSLLNKERDIRVDLSYQKSRLQSEQARKEKQDTLKVNKAKEKIFALNRERENLEELFEKEYPKYHKLKYNKTQPTVAQLQESLEPNNTLIEYFVGDSTLYAFTITKTDFQVKELTYPDSLAEKIQSLPNLLKGKKKEAFSNSSYELYKSLIAPLNLSTANLTIIPDGPLWQLNFDLLLSEKPEKLDYRKFQYLIKDYTISYAYSAKLLNQDVEYPKRSTAKNEVLAFSYNNPDDISVGSYIAMRGFRNAQLGDLPGTRKEIKAVSSVVDGAYYYGSYANEKNFKEKAKDYNILHLALHGVIDHEDPMNSKLYFTQDQDTLEDNYLHAYELYNLELNAELAVLSACQTGSGKLIKGEGVMSLGRAFTYAGCKSILLSQWDVSDAFTPGLMKDFYQNLKEGKTKAGALREAKLAYLAKADNLTSNPYYWAPLVQLGDNKPLKQDGYLKWVIGVSSILVLIALAFYLKNKRKVSEV